MMPTIQMPKSEVIALLRSAKLVYIRLSVVTDNTGTNIARSLIIDIVPQRWLDSPHISDNIAGPWWTPSYVFEAQQSLFFRGFKKSEEIFNWFLYPHECTLTHFDARAGYNSRVYRFGLPDFFDQVSSQRHASFDGAGFETIRYPHTLFNFQLQPLSMGRSEDYAPQVGWDSIEGDGARFQDFPTAQAELIFGITDPSRVHINSDAVAIRLIHAEGWLQEVRVFPDHVDVMVGGIDFLGGFVALDGSPSVRTRKRLMDHQASLPLPAEVPQNVQVTLLQRGSELDRASLTNPFMGMGHHSPQVIDERTNTKEQPTHIQDEPLPNTGGMPLEKAFPLPVVAITPITDDSNNAVFPSEIVVGTRGYIEKIVYQINTSYTNKCYDACAVMIRRLLETLIIEIFEAANLADTIKGTTGDFLFLGDLIDKTLAEKSWNLGRKPKEALKQLKPLKDMGDRSAHARRYNAVRSDIDKFKTPIRVIVEEFLYLAKLKA